MKSLTRPIAATVAAMIVPGKTGVGCVAKQSEAIKYTRMENWGMRNLKIRKQNCRRKMEYTVMESQSLTDILLHQRRASVVKRSSLYIN